MVLTYVPGCSRGGGGVPGEALPDSVWEDWGTLGKGNHHPGTRNRILLLLVGKHGLLFCLEDFNYTGCFCPTGFPRKTRQLLGEIMVKCDSREVFLVVLSTDSCFLEVQVDYFLNELFSLKKTFVLSILFEKKINKSNQTHPGT